MIFLVAIVLLLGQRQVHQETKATCGINVVGDNNTLICDGLTEKLAQRLIEFLEKNKIARTTAQADLTYIRARVAPPSLSAGCDLDENFSANRITCWITNLGSSEAKDVILSFSALAPANIAAFASPTLGLEHHYVDVRADEFPENVREIVTSSYVRILRIDPGETASFSLETNNPENRRTAAQCKRIIDQAKHNLSQTKVELTVSEREKADSWDPNLALRAFAKTINIFRPHLLTPGKSAVEWMTIEEERSLKAYLTLKARTPAVQKIVSARVELFAPVWVIRSGLESSTFMSLPPTVANVYGKVTLPVPTSLAPSFDVRFPVPESYEALDVRPQGRAQ